jgi:MFS family permease
MLLWAGDFRAVFWLAAIPAFLSVALLIAGVQEPPRPVAQATGLKFDFRYLARLGAPYWRVAAVGATFTLARFSEAFLVLRAFELQVPVAGVPLVMVAMNLAYAATAYPAGRLADTMSRDRLLAAGLGVLVLADLALALASGWALLGVGIALWGVHMGLTQGLLAAMVAHESPAQLRGTAYGAFSFLCGIAMLAASVIAGMLWQHYGSAATFVCGAAFSALALLALSRRPVV